MAEYSKAIVAAIAAILVVVEQIWGLKLGVSEEFLTSLIAIIGAILVWLIPNTSATT